MGTRARVRTGRIVEASAAEGLLPTAAPQAAKHGMSSSERSRPWWLPPRARAGAPDRVGAPRPIPAITTGSRSTGFSCPTRRPRAHAEPRAIGRCASASRAKIRRVSQLIARAKATNPQPRRRRTRRATTCAIVATGKAPALASDGARRDDRGRDWEKRQEV